MVLQVNHNFYVGDGLVSVDNEGEAVQLKNEARELCNTGGLRLQKFITNSAEVIAAIPKEEHGGNVPTLTWHLGNLK